MQEPEITHITKICYSSGG